MNNVAKIRTNYRDNTITTAEDYVKYEIYVPAGYQADFESGLSDKEYWTWMSKVKVDLL